MSSSQNNPESATLEPLEKSGTQTLSNLKTHPLPPAEFDPRTATDATLKNYGIPKRPDAAKSPKLAEHWDKVFSKKLTYITPQFVTMESLIPGITKTHGPINTANSNNSIWSGSVVLSPATDPFKSIAGLFNVPDVMPPSSTAGTYWMVSWIGIDGYGNNDVCQIGTVQAVSVAANGTLTKSCYAWTEWYPLSWVGIANFPINFGDTVYALLCINSPTQAGFNMVNETTGTHAGFTFNAPAGTTLIGNTAEWIVERPGIGGSTSNLAKFGEVYFDTAVASTKAGVSKDAGTGILLNMVEGSTTVSTALVENATLIKLTSNQ
ncbi:G1 family glutamic endopeptidase [Mucilaginibacter sp.]|uniref:G1 family glutamic endopeptidase n=1 Tax=Mucilaginibacter sp. TaxID=1882438 RepID=UPI003D0BE6AC